MAALDKELNESTLLGVVNGDNCPIDKDQGEPRLSAYNVNY